MYRYVLVAFVHHVEDGTEFSAARWPPHITIVPPFTINQKWLNLWRKLDRLLKRFAPMRLVAQHDEFFGQHRHTRVTLLKPATETLILHKDLIKMLATQDASLPPQHIGDNYRPHVTVQRSARVHKNDVITIAELSLVDMRPQGDARKRKVLATIKLSGSSASQS